MTNLINQLKCAVESGNLKDFLNVFLKCQYSDSELEVNSDIVKGVSLAEERFNKLILMTDTQILKSTEDYNKEVKEMLESYPSREELDVTISNLSTLMSDLEDLEDKLEDDNADTEEFLETAWRYLSEKKEGCVEPMPYFSYSPEDWYKKTLQEAKESLEEQVRRLQNEQKRVNAANDALRNIRQSIELL